ncbi:MAG: radical SAM protein [bacterium]
MALVSAPGYRRTPLYALWRRLKYSYLADRSPAVASLKITQRCNLACAHCTWVNKITADLPFERWTAIIDDLYRQGCIVIFLEGGEPTLRKDLEELISYTKRKGMICILFTNGTRDIGPYHPDAVWISVDGVGRAGDRLRGKGVFPKIKENINRNADKNIFSITAISGENLNEIELVCRELSKTAVQGLIFNFTYPYKDIKASSLSTGERVDCAARLLEFKKSYPKIVSSKSYLKIVGQLDKVCYPWILTLVTADGKQTHGCTVEAVEEKDCSQCDMMCGLESSLGFSLDRDSVEFWHKTKILPAIDIYPDWMLKLINRPLKKRQST